MTRAKIARSGAALLCCLAVVACGDDDDGGQPDAATVTADAAGAPDAESPVCGEGTIRWSMVLHESSPSGPPLAGVRSCVVGHDEIPCADSAADGTWEPCVPPDSDIAFSFVLTGYLSSVYAIHTGTDGATEGRWKDIVIFPETSACSFWMDVLDVECPPTTQGLLWINTFQNEPTAPHWPAPMGSVSGTLDPAADKGPMYLDELGNYDPSATASNAFRPSIWAAFTPDASQTITLSHPTLDTCGPLDGGWDGGAPNRVRLPILAGFRTYMATTCY